MKRFKNILLIINDKDTADNVAFRRAVELAKANTAKLTVMQVIKPPSLLAKWYKGIATAEELTSIFVNGYQSKLNELVEDHADDIEISTKVAVGRDFIEIVRQILLNGHDLLIKLANQTNTSFDSSDFHLMRKSPAPVWLIKPEHESTASRIVAAVDLTQETYEEGRLLNAQIMDLATSIARWEDADLYILSCWSLYGENALQHSPFLKVTNEKLDALLISEEEANISALQSIASRYTDVRLHTKLMKGDPELCIPAFTKDNAINLIVMGTLGRSGIPGFLIGNTSESILGKIDSSVITVKPSGFTSPIGLPDRF